MEGKRKDEPAPDNDDDALYEATAGWDSYVSGLLADTPPESRTRRPPRRETAPDEWEEREERRRKPRDRNPSGHRARLIKGEDPDEKRD